MGCKFMITKAIKKHVIYNIILVEDNGDHEVLASVKSQGLAYIVMQEFKKVYANMEVICEPTKKKSL